MDAANDNKTSAYDPDMQAHEVPSGTSDAFIDLKPLPQHQPIDDFIAEYLDQLFPIFLQGKVINLQEDTQALVLRHQLTQQSIDMLSDRVYDIMYHSDLSPEEKREAGIQLLLPYCANQTADANNLYHYTMLKNLVVDRIYLAANDRIDGSGSYEDDGLFGEAAITQHMHDLQHNAQMMHNVLVEYGVGAQQFAQIIRNFDAAAEKCVETFLGHEQGMGGPGW